MARLELEQQRTLGSGVRTSRRIDFSTAMALMRDQALDPYTHPLELIFGPAAAVGADRSPVERFVFRVIDSKPGIEIEIELVPGQLAEDEWLEVRSATWVRDRARSWF